MDPAALAWLHAQLGPATSTDDLTDRYRRLGTARAVAVEVLNERRAALLADPLRLVVDGVVTMDRTANLTGLERQLAALHDMQGPDETTNGEVADTSTDLATTVLVPSHRTR
ncbi:hypothetical protein [Kitasatospora cheerisanensis]|uniref:Uncharacterized protein n=1 Tax=Kitasatospora cheerisanensis KCTC 2395 TaxID=1348663 RepID=A0A066YWI6_9ACTN|nr:hypothetical protein [Kitasatospora cheerisanensis]KDN85592.1 hypothetical protein KCH_26090 [Kitasatospora cheerisanensis KCTC 2395]